MGEDSVDVPLLLLLLLVVVFIVALVASEAFPDSERVALDEKDVVFGTDELDDRDGDGDSVVDDDSVGDDDDEEVEEDNDVAMKIVSLAIQDSIPPRLEGLVERMTASTKAAMLTSCQNIEPTSNYKSKNS